MSENWITNSYDYLLHKTLFTGNRMMDLRGIVQEIYFEIINRPSAIDAGSGEIIYYPDLQEITGMIDDMNMEIISNFFHQYKVSEENIDHVISLYQHYVSPDLDLSVKECVDSLGYLCSNDNPFSVRSVHSVLSENMFAQLVFPDFWR